jgi:hypothetical protein
VDKLSIGNEMAQLDLKNRDFYNELTPDERKKFSNYLMIRWGSCVQGSRDLQEFYLIATNQRLNRHFFTINRHPQLQWLCATSVSPGIGRQKHQWIAPTKRQPGAASLQKQLSTLFPHLRDDETRLLAQITTKADLTAYLKEQGQEP